MKTVTAIERQKRRKERVNLFLDGDFALSLTASVAAEVGLHQGQQLSPKEIEKLQHTDLFQCSLSSALRYLSQRPRSEAEVRTRLRRHGYDADTIQEVLDRLKALKLIDDVAFARLWRENRESFRPRSRRLIYLELKRKGVDADTVTEATEGLDDESSAYSAAGKKALSLARLDYPTFRKRLGAFLKQRGFSYELINHTVERLWQEQGKQQPTL